MIWFISVPLTLLVVHHCASTLVEYPTSRTICRNCSYRNNYWFVTTDAQGDTTPVFSCAAQGAREVCDRDEAVTINSYVPSMPEICSSVQPDIICHNPEPVTIWGDSRSDPSYITSSIFPTSATLLDGRIRDWDVNTFRMIASKLGYDRDPQQLDIGDDVTIYAYSGSSPLTSLLGYNGNLYPNNRIGYFPSTNGWNWDAVPKYKNYNNKLLIYAGSENRNFIVDDALEDTTCDIKCTNRRMYNYLTQHRGVTTDRAIFFSEIQHYKFTQAEITAHRNIFTGSAFTCTDTATCFNNIKRGTSASGFPVWQTCSGFLNGGGVLDFCVIASTTRALSMPTAADPDAYIMNYVYLGENRANMYTYPLTTWYVFRQDVHTTFGFVQYVEQSEDGVTWIPMQESMGSRSYAAYLTGDIILMHKTMLTDPEYPCLRATSDAINLCRMVIGVTGRNKYMRLTAAYPVGSNARWTGIGTVQGLRTYPPTMLFRAQEKAPVSVYVTPSLSAVAAEAEDYAVCAEVENCFYIPSGVGNTYPTDGVTVGGITGGSPTVRAFLRDTVMPQVHGCTQRLDPIREFLRNNDYSTPNVCHRTGIEDMTCYAFAASASADNTVRIEPGDGNNRVYFSNGRSLSVTYRTWSPPFPIPKLVIGPIGTTSLSPKYYMYTDALPGTFKYGPYYFSTTEICTLTGAGTAPAVDNLPVDNNCVCSDVSLNSDKCLCLAAPSYKSVPPRPTVATPKNTIGTTIPEGRLFVTGITSTFYRNSFPVSIENFSACQNAICGRGVKCEPEFKILFDCNHKVDTINMMLRELTTSEVTLGGYFHRFFMDHSNMTFIRPQMRYNTTRPTTRVNTVRAVNEHCDGVSKSPAVILTGIAGLLQKDNPEMPLDGMDVIASYDRGVYYNEVLQKSIARSTFVASFCERRWEGLSDLLNSVEGKIKEVKYFIQQLTQEIATPYGYTLVEYFPDTNTYGFTKVGIIPKLNSVVTAPVLCISGAVYTPAVGYTFIAVPGGWNISPKDVYGWANFSTINTVRSSMACTTAMARASFTQTAAIGTNGDTSGNTASIATEAPIDTTDTLANLTDNLQNEIPLIISLGVIGGVLLVNVIVTAYMWYRLHYSRLYNFII